MGRAGGARGGGMKWVVKKPVVDSGCSRHFFGRDVESYVVKVRETDSEFVGVEGDVARAESDVTVDLPGVECVDGCRRTARLDEAFSRSMPVSLVSVHGLRLQKVREPFWVELPEKGGGSFRTRMKEEEGVLVLSVHGGM
mmetsp:Transcript_39959/g.78771  ORF Transcript_39959/g.78771 Transcript_39959/m.78771 type:complete len:140 (+) Transcript_39959:720-1139(+)